MPISRDMTNQPARKQRTNMEAWFASTWEGTRVRGAEAPCAGAAGRVSAVPDRHHFAHCPTSEADHMRAEIVNFLKQARRPPQLEVERQIGRGRVALELIFSMLFAVGAVMSARADSRPPPVPRGGLYPSGFTYFPTSKIFHPGNRRAPFP
jgi:hypothetical protein